MGLYGSKPLMTPKDAQHMLGSDMWQRLEQAYRRMGEGNALTLKAFHKYFLGGFPLMVRNRCLSQHILYLYELWDATVP
jgi:hypothetical protein